MLLLLLLFTEVKEVFDLFDFWDGRDGLVDGYKVGEVMRCCGLNPTNKIIYEKGGTKKLGRGVRWGPFVHRAPHQS